MSNNPPPPPQPAPASPRPPSGPSRVIGRRQDWAGGLDRTPRWQRGAARADRWARRHLMTEPTPMPIPPAGPPSIPGPKAA